MGILDMFVKKSVEKMEKTVKGDVLGVAEGLREATTAILNLAGEDGEAIWNEACGNQTYDSRSFDEKLTQVIGEAGNYEIRQNIALAQLEQEFGEDMYVHGRSNCYCKPDDISYGIYQDGKRVLLIRLWPYYELYNHAANREVWEYCREHQIKILDFYDYLPNEESYMADRIRRELDSLQ